MVGTCCIQKSHLDTKKVDCFVDLIFQSAFAALEIFGARALGDIFRSWSVHHVTSTHINRRLEFRGPNYFKYTSTSSDDGCGLQRASSSQSRTYSYDVRHCSHYARRRLVVRHSSWLSQQRSRTRLFTSTASNPPRVIAYFAWRAAHR